MMSAAALAERVRVMEGEAETLENALKKETVEASELRFKLTVLEESHEELSDSYELQAERLREWWEPRSRRWGLLVRDGR